MTSMFTAQADTSPYKHIVPKQDLEQANPPLKASPAVNSGPRASR